MTRAASSARGLQIDADVGWMHDILEAEFEPRVERRTVLSVGSSHAVECSTRAGRWYEVGERWTSDLREALGWVREEGARI